MSASQNSPRSTGDPLAVLLGLGVPRPGLPASRPQRVTPQPCPNPNPPRRAAFLACRPALTSPEYRLAAAKAAVSLRPPTLARPPAAPPPRQTSRPYARAPLRSPGIPPALVPAHPAPIARDPARPHARPPRSDRPGSRQPHRPTRRAAIAYRTPPALSILTRPDRQFRLSLKLALQPIPESPTIPPLGRGNAQGSLHASTAHADGRNGPRGLTTPGDPIPRGHSLMITLINPISLGPPSVATASTPSVPGDPKCTASASPSSPTNSLHSARR